MNNVERVSITAIGMVVFILGMFALVGTAHAGWVVKHASGDMTYLSSGKSKEESKEDGTWTIADGASGKISMLRPDKKIYWQGTVEEFCAAVKQMMPQLANKPAKPKVSVEAAGGDTIAGHAAQKYRVMANGQLHEEVWIAEIPGLTEELNASNRKTDIGKCYAGQTLDEYVERDPAYVGLQAKGYVMKKVSYMSGAPVNSKSVVSLKQKNIAASEFEVPSGYRRIQSMMEIWM